MTRHDWIVLSGIVAVVVLAAAGFIFQGGRLDNHVSEVERRIERVEYKLDDVQQRLSRIEGYLGADPAARSPIDD